MGFEFFFLIVFRWVTSMHVCTDAASLCDACKVLALCPAPERRKIRTNAHHMHFLYVRLPSFTSFLNTKLCVTTRNLPYIQQFHVKFDNNYSTKKSFFFDLHDTPKGSNVGAMMFYRRVDARVPHSDLPVSY